MSRSVAVGATGINDIKNPHLSVGIAFLSVLEREICTSGLVFAILHLQCCSVTGVVSVRFAELTDFNDVRLTFEFSFLSVEQREVSVLLLWNLSLITSGVDESGYHQIFLSNSVGRFSSYY